MSKVSKIQPEDFEQYLSLIEDGYSQRKGCEILGLKRSTLQDYIKRKQKELDCVKQEVLNGSIGNDYSNWITEEKPSIRFDVDVEKYNFPDIVNDHFVIKKPALAESMQAVGKSFKAIVDSLSGGSVEEQKPLSKKKPTILVIADTQCKSEESLEYMLWIGQYIADKKPDIIVHIGDHYDFPSLSSYDKGKSSAEGKRLHKDIEAGNKGFEYLNMAMQSIPDYNPRKVFCIGNHCERLSRYVDNNPELIGTLGLDKLPFVEYGWEVYPFLKPVEIEGIFFVHYLANPFNGKPYGGNAMNILKTVGRSFVVGHKQCLDIAIRPTIDGKQQIGIINGAAYPFDEKYKGYQGNNHFRGVTMLYEVDEGFGLPKFISINHLKERYYS